jgi:hypothetical protein
LDFYSFGHFVIRCGPIGRWRGDNHCMVVGLSRACGSAFQYGDRILNLGHSFRILAAACDCPIPEMDQAREPGNRKVGLYWRRPPRRNRDAAPRNPGVRRSLRP